LLICNPYKKVEMSFNLSIEAKRSLLIQRIESLNLEGYQHELNKKSAEALGNQDVVEQSNQAIEIIKSAIAVHETELADLGE
jgi:hypothetical protein